MDAGLAFWFEISEPASEYFTVSGQIDGTLAARKVVVSMVLSALAACLVLVDSFRAIAIVLAVGATAGLSLVGMGLITNSMAEYGGSSPRWDYIGLTFSSGFLIAASASSLIRLVWFLVGRLR